MYVVRLGLKWKIRILTLSPCNRTFSIFHIAVHQTFTHFQYRHCNKIYLNSYRTRWSSREGTNLGMVPSPSPGPVHPARPLNCERWNLSTIGPPPSRWSSREARRVPDRSPVPAMIQRFLSTVSVFDRNLGAILKFVGPPPRPPT